MRPISSFRFNLLALAACAALAGCALSPAYQRPVTLEPAAYKEAPGWQPAAPADMLERGPWWTLFGDPVLNELAASVEVSNQNVAAAAAAYEEARAIVREQRAQLFPAVELSGSGARSGSSGAAAPANRVANSYRLNLGGSWEPDIWGRLRAATKGASASAAASSADLAAARLSAQSELASNYFSLRQSDAQLALLAATISGYGRLLEITRNRFNAGIAGSADVLQAQTQLANARIDELTLMRQRAQLEHAIAVLLGKVPAGFTLAVAPWKAEVPEVPAGLPSTLLERRPDIAAAERRVAAANERIGIARAAYFPSLNLNASYGSGASRVADLFAASSSLWSLGVSAAQTLFNAGATGAAVAAARASHAAEVARYRQTVLAAFADVEDQLSASGVLSRQQDLHRIASQAADRVEVQMQNRYQAGQVAYTEVVLASATALASRRALVQAQAGRQIAAVALIAALGGGWHAGS
jgi:NodT family efflux transporter outer membrane factor (OMF) lipoprotein